MTEGLKEKVIREFIERRAVLFLAGHEISENEEIAKQQIEKLLNKACQHDGVRLSPQEKTQAVNEVLDAMVGFGVIKPLFLDPTVSEIMINGPYQIYVERGGKKQLLDSSFKDEKQLKMIIEKMLRFSRRHVDETIPYVDLSLPDGSRINIIIPPLSLIGPVVTIRKFSQGLNRIEDLIGNGSISQGMAQFLVACIKARLNIIFSGATGSGKTTTLNVLSSYINENERIVTIEDTAELYLKQNHVVRLETRRPNIEGKGEITIRELFINSLRMRPDRIILGEIRSGEALDMLQAIASGHAGSLSVIHGESVEDVIARLETMIVISNSGIPLHDVKKQIALGLDVIVQQERFPDGIRRITDIAEVRGLDDRGEVELCSLFSFQQDSVDSEGKVIGRWIASGEKPLFFPVFRKKGIGLLEEIFRR